MQALKEAQDANAANIAKTTFLNHMSHDIGTPMNAIVGFTDIAMKRKPDKEVENCLKKIRQSSEYLMTLINDVLDISRIESGKLEYKPVQVDLRDMINTVLSISRGYIENRDLNLYISREELKTPYVMADELRIYDVCTRVWGLGIPIKRLTRRYGVAIKWRYGNTRVDLALMCTPLYNETLRGCFTVGKKKKYQKIDD